MFKEQYINELNRLKPDKNFKADTIALLQQKQQEYYIHHNTVQSPKTVYAKKSYKKLAAACACIAAVILSVSAVRLYRGSSASSFSQQQTFTIKDIQAVEEISSPEYVVQAQYDNGGSFGYEGILLKDIGTYDNGNPFSIYDSFDTLPIYHFTPFSLSQAETETDNILKAFSADSSAAEREIILTELVYTNGHLSSHRDSTLSSEEFALVKLKDSVIPHRYEASFDGGDIQMWLPKGETRIRIDTDAEITDSQITEYISQNYSSALGYTHSTVCADIDYNIYGEENPTYYIYDHSDDYAQNIFNYSVNNTRVYYSAKEESLEDYDQFIFWIKNNCYTRGKELPAVNWRQALGLLYNGEYYSSVPYEISEESTVSRIELVYKEAPYDSMLLTRSSVSVPFYKFYVELKEMSIEEQGLTDYGIYYVCAIDPSYIEITENYAQFN